LRGGPVQTGEQPHYHQQTNAQFHIFNLSCFFKVQIRSLKQRAMFKPFSGIVCCPNFLT
jgi:hypothetical protein